MGAESSGNRLMMRYLIAAGCQGNAQPPYADITPNPQIPFVWLRSVPYAQEVPDLKKWVTDAWHYTDDVTAVVMLRDMYPSLMSQVKIRHAPDYETARKRTRNALLTIFRTLDDLAVPFIPVTYLGLVNHTADVVKWMVSECGLSTPQMIEETYNGDDPWWRDSMERYTG